MKDTQSAFGLYVRRKRKEQQISLRRFSQYIGVSPTYVSQFERGAFSPPSEYTIKRIAEILEENADELLARADKISSDLIPIIQKYPKEISNFLRAATSLTQEEWEHLIGVKIPNKETRKAMDDARLKRKLKPLQTDMLH